MVRMLTKEDVENTNKEIEKWWNSLDQFFKDKIYNYFRDIIIQIKCKHELIEGIYYDQKILSCKNCPYVESIKKEVK